MEEVLKIWRKMRKSDSAVCIKSPFVEHIFFGNIIHNFS